jgi:hypothetical protein
MSTVEAGFLVERAGSGVDCLLLLVFRAIPENTTLQTQVINLGLKTEAIFNCNFFS